MNYRRTLIAVADDCPVVNSTAPALRNGKKTVAFLQYEMLAEQPYRLTQEDILFMSWLERQAGADSLEESERMSLRESFFSKEQPCLRTSPLPRKHGFGLVFDSEGLVALCPMESDEYRHLIDGKEVRIVKAMRSSRR
jgi:uncharacterized protein DUF6157